MKNRTGKFCIYCSLNVLSELLNCFLLYYVNYVVDVEVIFLMNYRVISLYPVVVYIVGSFAYR